MPASAAHQGKALVDIPYPDLQKKLVSRRSADDLRDFLHHHNLSVSGTKPLLVDRVVQFAIEKTEPALAEDIGDAVVEEVVPKELTEDALVKRIANISEGERDLLVGRFLRLLGGDHATQYGELLRAAIRADPPEFRGRMVDSDDKDKYVPPRAHTWTWRHFHSRHSDGGARSFCNPCAWDIPTHCGPNSLMGRLPT